MLIITPVTNPGADNTPTAPELVLSCISLNEEGLHYFLIESQFYKDSIKCKGPSPSDWQSSCIDFSEVTKVLQ